VTQVGPTHASLAWSATDDGPFVWYWVYKDGVPILQGIRNGTGIAHLLQPTSSYTFTVRARDFAGNWAPVSAPVRVTTTAANPNDVTPPTPPGNLREDHYDTEIELSWDQSTDDLDPQWIIRYDVLVNGVLNAIVVGQGRTIVSGVAGLNTIEVVAVDTAGNRSIASTITSAL
jgi:chitin-binding protein